jgi:hypothetical protein
MFLIPYTVLTESEEKIDRKQVNLIKRKEIWVITIKGWLIIAAASMITLGFFIKFVHPFFAITDPKRGKILVVEGWLPRYAIERAIQEFKAHGYQKIMTTGGPIYSDLPCGEYKNFADLGAALLQDLHQDPERITAVPAPDAKKDRTYVAARALKRWFDKNDRHPESLDIVTLGPHARRSLILYKMALGANVTVGVISVPGRGYDPDRWLRYSQGVKTVINEVIGYLYTQLIFDPEKV